MSEAITRASLWGLNHYAYGEAYFGSHMGMRFRVARQPLENVSFRSREEQAKDASLSVSVWPEPYAFAKTPKEEITEQTFPFSEEGMEDAVQWLNEQYHTRFFQN